MSTDVSVDLAAKQAKIQGETITIGSATEVTKVFTGDGNDTLVGDAGDDFLLAGRGTNTVDGGGGVNTAAYVGSRKDYAATYSSSGVFQIDSTKYGLSDFDLRIQKTAFDEGTIPVQAASNTALGVVALYQGLLFRIADTAGYHYWTDQAAAGVGLTAIANSFAASTEYANNGAELDNQTFLANAYDNMLHRDIDAAGASY